MHGLRVGSSWLPTFGTGGCEGEKEKEGKKEREVCGVVCSSYLDCEADYKLLLLIGCV